MSCFGPIIAAVLITVCLSDLLPVPVAVVLVFLDIQPVMVLAALLMLTPLRRPDFPVLLSSNTGTNGVFSDERLWWL